MIFLDGPRKGPRPKLRAANDINKFRPVDICVWAILDADSYLEGVFSNESEANSQLKYANSVGNVESRVRSGYRYDYHQEPRRPFILVPCIGRLFKDGSVSRPASPAGEKALALRARAERAEDALRNILKVPGVSHAVWIIASKAFGP